MSVHMNIYLSRHINWLYNIYMYKYNRIKITKFSTTHPLYHPKDDKAPVIST